ncbi:hypothetical protein SG09_77320 [Bradyrhizobium ottawaense]|jgi:hypothetical protein|uniref:Uncharacterized protein n=1 Tax=Bradyrhizobium diazoefficiens TaxID=1355477 RepID=A0A809XJ33_9BRAD|nr:hypothetical protein SG09_77320 [Bradyrhizobium ottawaense]BCA00892.1 hypothetical protein H12S4_17960 [Bradyrhizobium diazoefficiens]GLR92564.1 hypothetical protein GCM10007858_01830 [Bradyrhizobium liaoningense]BCA18572.1 hypothetical protein BDHH15_17870 [Bradyrhizobium diazoefficiens]BCE28022.1 hypothetical protein XF2B_17910 [Bradyrhizobium diazoefficiens]
MLCVDPANKSPKPGNTVIDGAWGELAPLGVYTKPRQELRVFPRERLADQLVLRQHRSLHLRWGRRQLMGWRLHQLPLNGDALRIA